MPAIRSAGNRGSIHDFCPASLFFDAIQVKIRNAGLVRNTAVTLALGIQPDGTKDVLGIWIEQTEGATFWMRVMNELKNRGIADILIAVVDGLKGFREAITAVFPKTVVQTCIVHLIRALMSFASWKDRKEVARELRAVYRAADEGPGKMSCHSLPFSRLSGRMIYTTNAIEALNSKLRRAGRTRGHFANDDAAMKLLYLVLSNAAED